MEILIKYLINALMIWLILIGGIATIIGGIIIWDWRKMEKHKERK